MIIHTLWGTRYGESTPELMVAWDEYTLDGYREGFDQECERAILSWKNDLQEKRYVDIEVDEQRITDAFKRTCVPGFVKEAVFAAGDEVTVADPDAPAGAPGERGKITDVYPAGTFPFPSEYYGEYLGDEPADGQFYRVELVEGGETLAGQADLEIV